MPQPCTVCSHLERASIDRRLAVQRVNVAQIAREYGLGYKAVTRHRERHLPDFLVGLTARAQLPDLEVLTGEAQRLYLTTLDALAQAEAGTLAQVGKDRLKRPHVSLTAVAALLREARAGLELLAKLAAQGDTGPETVRPESTQLEARLLAALDSRAERLALERGPIDEAQVIEDESVDTQTSPDDSGIPTHEVQNVTAKAPDFT